eukprot:tig00001224_g7647.t1
MPLLAEMLAQKRRLLVEAGLSGLLWGVGDLISQRIEGLEEIDVPRLTRMAGYGAALAGPTCSFWYRWIDKAAPSFVKSVKLGFAESAACQQAWRSALHAWRLASNPAALLRCPKSAVAAAAEAAAAQARAAAEAARRAAAELGQIDKSCPNYRPLWSIIATKLVFDTMIFEPTNLVIFFLIQDMLEGKSVGEAWEHVGEMFGPTFKYDVAVWSPVQLVNFRFVSPASQGLVVNAVSVGWNAFLSLVQSQGLGAVDGAPGAPPDDHVPGSAELHWNKHEPHGPRHGHDPHLESSPRHHNGNGWIIR